MTTQRIIPGDCIEGMRTLADGSIHCCVTSPPYWGLRDYGHEGQIGLEDTPEAYVGRMVEVFREVRRVLRDDGTAWVNLGDSYAGSWGNQGRKETRGTQRAINGPMLQKLKAESVHEIECCMDDDCVCAAGDGGIYPDRRTKTGSWVNDHPTLKAKDLVGIPWRVAFALQADGWWLRQDIIWHKPNPMPESVRDRCTKAHEYFFLLTKSDRYFYDADAIRQPLRWQDPAFLVTNAQARQQKRLTERILAGDKTALRTESDRRTALNGLREKGRGKHKNAESTLQENILGANRRSVWTVTTKPYSGAHFAVMPPDLVEPCIKAGCPEGGTVLDPFAGSGTTLAVAAELGRNAIGCELNPAYIELAEKRIKESRAGVALFEGGAA
jgi:DNA modification methylase